MSIELHPAATTPLAPSNVVQGGRKPGWLASAAMAVGVVALVAGAIVALAVYRGGSARGAAIYLMGRPLMVTPGQIDLPARTSKPVTIEVRNLSGHPTQLVGYTVTCSCLSAAGMSRPSLRVRPHRAKGVRHVGPQVPHRFPVPRPPRHAGPRLGRSRQRIWRCHDSSHDGSHR